MKRLTTALVGLVLFAAACGSGDDGEDVLATLGLSDGEATCFRDAFDERGLDMDSILAADRDDLSSEQLQAVLDVSAACAGADTPAASGDADESAETETDSTSDENSAGDDPAEGSDDQAEGSDDPADAPTRTYDDLNAFEQGFVDGLVGSGGTEAIAICMLDEFEAAGISMLELAELGLSDDATPSPEVMEAILRCGDEMADAGLFDTDEFFTGAEGDTYGDNAELDALWDACGDGDLTACDDLYFDSAIGSAYETFGSTCGDTQEQQFGFCATAGTGTDTERPQDYGDDPQLDALYDACAGGDNVACDDLWFSTAVGSGYEAFAESCGGRSTEAQWGTCVESLGG